MSRLKPPKAALLANADDVEAQFYEALQQADLDKLMALWSDDDETSLSLTRPELELFLQGCRVVGAMQLAPTPLCEKDLVIRA